MKGCACAEAAGPVRHPRGAEACLPHPQGRHRHPAAGEALRCRHDVQWTCPTTTWLIHCLHSLQHIQFPSLAACRSACQAKSASDVSTSGQWRQAMHAGAQPTSQIMHTETSGARHALQGRMMLLLGPPGGGKTTLLNALAGKLHSSKGLRVRFNSLQHSCSVVPSHPYNTHHVMPHTSCPLSVSSHSRCCFSSRQKPRSCCGNSMRIVCSL